MRRGVTPAVVAAAFACGLGLGLAGAPVSAGRSAELLPAKPAVAAVIAYPAEVLKVLDGDTFDARVHVWPGLSVTTKVRLRGIDAPELKSRCAEERERAETARAMLAAILGQGEVAIMRVSLDKYGGRVLADAATRATTDVSATLLHAGLVRAYGGGRREGWCP